MKRVLSWMANITFWCTLTAMAAVSYGYEQGYRNGVRDIGKLVLRMHEAPALPEPPPASQRQNL